MKRILFYFILFIFLAKEVFASSETEFFFESEKNKIFFDEEFNFDIKIKPAEEKITALAFYINFPTNLIECFEMKVDRNKWNILSQEDIDNQKGRITASVGLIPQEKLTSSVVDVASFFCRCKSKEEGLGNVYFDKKTSGAALGKNDNVIDKLGSLEFKVSVLESNFKTEETEKTEKTEETEEKKDEEKTKETKLEMTDVVANNQEEKIERSVDDIDQNKKEVISGEKNEEDGVATIILENNQAMAKKKINFFQKIIGFLNKIFRN